MREMLPPLFQIATGLSFLLVLVVGLAARRAIARSGLRLVGMALVALALALFCLSQATAASSIGAGATMFIGAGVSVLLAGVFVVVGLLLEARGARPGA